MIGFWRRGACSLGVLFLCLAANAQADEAMPLSPRLQALARELSAGDRMAAGRFWNEVRKITTPLIEAAPDGRPDEMLVTFLWQAAGQGSNIRVLPYFLGEVYHYEADVCGGAPLFQLKDSDVLYRSFVVPSAARFQYSFQRDVQKLPHEDGAAESCTPGVNAADPFNPETHLDEAENVLTPPEKGVLVSYAAGPRAPALPFAGQRADVARGKVETIDFDSRNLVDGHRTVSVYTPPGFEPQGESYGVVVMFDGQDVLAAGAATALDNMLADGVIAPLIAIFIDTGKMENRNLELSPLSQLGPKFQSFVVDELMPWARARYHISADPARAVIAGVSMGGLAAASIGFNHPQAFGNVLSQSGSYWWWPAGQVGIHLHPADMGWMTRQYAEHDRLPLRFYMEVGVFEPAHMVLTSRSLRDVLRGKGYEVLYEERESGHENAGWRGLLAKGLIALVGTGKAEPGASP